MHNFSPQFRCAGCSGTVPHWSKRVNEPQSEKEFESVRWSITRGSPYGNEEWVESIARRLGLESTLRPRGRPRIHS